MPGYDDRRFSPPAPVIEARLRNPRTGVSAPGVELLIDTGADVTLLPRTVADSLQIERSRREYELVGFDGARSVAEAVHAELTLLHKIFRGQFLLIDQPIGFVGRDVLNSLFLAADGPRLTWQERPPTSGT